MWPDPAQTGPGADSSTENTLPTGLSGPAVHVLDRSVNSHGKASSQWPHYMRPIQRHLKKKKPKKKPGGYQNH